MIRLPPNPHLHLRDMIADLLGDGRERSSMEIFAELQAGVRPRDLRATLDGMGDVLTYRDQGERIPIRYYRLRPRAAASPTPPPRPASSLFGGNP